MFHRLLRAAVGLFKAAGNGLETPLIELPIFHALLGLLDVLGKFVQLAGKIGEFPGDPLPAFHQMRADPGELRRMFRTRFGWHQPIKRFDQ